MISQLIYKKTILPCPLPFFYEHESNMSMNGSDALGLYTLQNASALASISAVNGPHLDPHAPVHSAVQFTPHPEDTEDMCTPKYFVFNSQVTMQTILDKYVIDPVRREDRAVNCAFVVFVSFRPRTPSPSSPLLSCVILKFCPSTVNSKSEKNFVHVQKKKTILSNKLKT